MKNIIISVVAVIMAVIIIPLTIVLIMENTIDNSEKPVPAEDVADG